MERLPINPDELEAEQEAAQSAVQEEEAATHENHHKAWIHTHRLAAVKPHAALSTEAERAAEEEQELLKDEADEEEDEFQAALARIPAWRSQLTLRGLAVGLLLGALFCIVTHKLNLGPGIIPSLNIAAGLLAFCCLKGWAAAVRWLGGKPRPFNAQECNAVQTFITACSSVAFTGGFGSYVTALDHRSYDLVGPDTPGNRIQDVYEPHLRRLIPYLLSTSVIGVFMLVALRKTMIIDYNLTYPSGTATGLMIQSFFTTKGAKTVGAQLQMMGRFFGVSVAWDAFKWLFSNTGCSFCSASTPCGGFEAFPFLGLKAAKWTFYLNMTPNIVGAGMICPHIVNMSLLFGAVLTWGFLWPWIAQKEGSWYPSGLDEHAFGGLFGYKVFITLSLLMGDGIYNLCKVLVASARAYYELQRSSSIPADTDSCGPSDSNGKPTGNKLANGLNGLKHAESDTDRDTAPLLHASHDHQSPKAINSQTNPELNAVGAGAGATHRPAAGQTGQEANKSGSGHQALQDTTPAGVTTSSTGPAKAGTSSTGGAAVPSSSSWNLTSVVTRAVMAPATAATGLAVAGAGLLAAPVVAAASLVPSSLVPQRVSGWLTPRTSIAGAAATTPDESQHPLVASQAETASASGGKVGHSQELPQQPSQQLSTSRQASAEHHQLKQQEQKKQQPQQGGHDADGHHSDTHTGDAKPHAPVHRPGVSVYGSHPGGYDLREQPHVTQSTHASASAPGIGLRKAKPAGRVSGQQPIHADGGADASLRQPLLETRSSLDGGSGVRVNGRGQDHVTDVSGGDAFEAKQGEELSDQEVPAASGLKESPLEHRLRTHVFVTDTIPLWISALGYLSFGIVGCLVIPHVYPAVPWYFVLLGFCMAPILALPVSFGCGLTDWDVSSMIGKLGIFFFASLAGLSSGGVVAGLAMSGVLMTCTSTCATLMQDFRTGYINKCAPRAMFISQLLGAFAGTLIAPLTFSLFWATGRVGDVTGPYPTPYAPIFRALAIFSTQGLSVLPQHCATFMALFFTAAILVNLARDLLPQKYARYLPIPMAAAIPCVLGAYIAIDMAVGSLIVWLWEQKDRVTAELLAPAVASGLIVGDGMVSIPVSVASMAGLQAPFCLGFGSSGAK